MNDSAVRNPKLRELVELARAQCPPELGVTVEDVWARSEARERSSRNKWLVAGVSALAAGLLAWVAVGGPGARVGHVDASDGAPAQANKTVASRSVDGAVASSRGPAGRGPSDATEVEAPEAVEIEPARAAAVALAEGVSVEPLDAAGQPVIVSAWQVQVAGGRYRVETPSSGEHLEIVVGERKLRVEPGSRLVFDAAGALEVERGSATWIGDATAKAEPTAAALSREAERAMVQGRRKDAIRALTRLVRTHPRSVQSRAGLVDLARLHKAAGDYARARCAYQLYLARFPRASLRPDVERALHNLGEGRSCRGLAPASR